MSSETVDVKSCCAAAYESDFARLLLGDSFHPGGSQLTERLGVLLKLGPGVRVLDVASGKGASAIFLAQKFGCEVAGVDFGESNVTTASGTAEAAGVSSLVTFQQGDAERLPFDDATFDAVICECAFCTFPDKTTAAGEFARVLRAGGRVGLSDLTRSGPLPKELDGLLAWVSCIADARPISEYVRYLEAAGLAIGVTEPHDEALSQMVRDIQGRMMGAELMVKLRKLDLPGVNFEDAKATATSAAEAVKRGLLGYSLLTASLKKKPSPRARLLHSTLRVN